MSDVKVLPSLTATRTHASDDRTPAEPVWSAFTRFLLGVVCGYFILVWVPWGLAVLANVNIPYQEAETVGRWVVAHVLRLPEHSPAGPANNYLPSYVAPLAFTAMSGSLSVVWLLLDRRPANFRRIFIWLHTAVRFLLGALMLVYGWGKVLPGQFGRFVAGTGTEYLITQVGQTTPRDLLWAFMEASRHYQIFTGLIEVSGGVLIMFRRTAMLGACLCLAAMINVWVLDVAYDVPAKLVASQMLLMAVFAMAPYAGRVLNVFVLNRSTLATSPRPLFMQIRRDRAARALGAVCAGAIAFWTLQSAVNVASERRAVAHIPLHGIWDVEEMNRNGMTVSASFADDAIWRRLVFPLQGRAVAVSGSGSLFRYNARVDDSSKTIQLRPYTEEFVVPASAVGGSHFPPKNNLSFRFSQIDNDHLLLNEMDRENPAMIRLRRFAPASYRLFEPKLKWYW